MPRDGLTLAGGGFYPHSFTEADLDELERFVLDEHAETITLSEFYDGDRRLDRICVRHDVDHDAEHAVAFARWEADRGIRASYFLLPTAPYYASQAHGAALELQALGHEVGVHNDSFSAADGDQERALSLLRSWADEMRSWGIEVRGCADHGGTGPSNVDLWRVHGRTPSEAGLDWEAYLLHQQDTHYLSDNRGGWKQPLHTRDDRPTHLLAHPCHWRLPVEVPA